MKHLKKRLRDLVLKPIMIVWILSDDDIPVVKERMKLVQLEVVRRILTEFTVLFDIPIMEMILRSMLE